MQYFDLIIPSVALAQGFGRIGCFLAGCCYGQETSSWFGVVFPENSFAPSGVALIPTQLISSGLDFLLFFVLVFFARKKKVHGQVAALYLLLYSAGRFVLEFYRGDIIRGNVGVLSTSQFIAIILFAISIGMMVISSKRQKLKAS
ncbi:Prolipoprotein diacylglyceryl transferase [compost metagenome]